MMAGVSPVCEECEGRTFSPSVLEYRFGNRDISEVLAMSVAEARAFLRRRVRPTPGGSRSPSSSDWFDVE